MRSLLVLTIVVASYGVAHAEEDTAKADVIFEEAQKLKAAGKHAEACAKYEESLSYNHNAVGTLLNVGLCAEEAGKYATAVKHYTQARDLAREHKLEEHRKAAEEKLTVAAPLVAHLAIAFAERVDNMKLVIGEEVVPVDKTDDIVLDPGTHHIVVSAPGRVSYESNIELEKGKAKAIAVPKLGYPVTVNKGRRTIGKIFTIGGAALVVTGIGVGVWARSRYNAEFEPMGAMPPRCDRETLMCNPDGHTETENARTLGYVGTAIGIAGGVAAGVGAYLWLFAGSGTSTNEKNVAIVPTVTPESAGLSAVGRF
jgi:hypothetical protein